MHKKRRSLNHIKEDISYQVLRDSIPETWVIHTYGQDYGIDCVIELFDYIDDEKNMAETLGEQFFVQLKSSGSIKYSNRQVYPRGNVEKGKLVENKSEFIEIEVAKFQLEMSELLTVQAMGLAIPVLLILVDTNTKRAFFLCLNDYIDKILIPEDSEYSKQASKTLYIPLKNEITRDEDNLVPLRTYGKRSKMYAGFSKFYYQKKEIERALGLAQANTDEDIDIKINMVKVFIESAIRLDIWSSHEFWKPIEACHNELTELQQNLNDGINIDEQQYFLEFCNYQIWHRLSNLGNMYEELVREWYLPTFLAQLLSYPDDPAVKEKA